MSVNVKSGTPEGVHRNIPNQDTKENVRDFDESLPRSRPEDVVELRGKGAESLTRSGDVHVESGSTKIFEKHPTIRKDGHARELVFDDSRAENFLAQMEEGFSPGETNQSNPFEFPAVRSTKPRTLSEAMGEFVLRFKLMMVACWLPKDYRVLPPQKPMPDPMMVDLSIELKAIAKKLWESYEPLLGAHNTVSVLQVEAPPEEDE